MRAMWWCSVKKEETLEVEREWWWSCWDFRGIEKCALFQGQSWGWRYWMEKSTIPFSDYGKSFSFWLIPKKSWDQFHQILIFIKAHLSSSSSSSSRKFHEIVEKILPKSTCLEFQFSFSLFAFLFSISKPTQQNFLYSTCRNVDEGRWVA